MVTHYRWDFIGLSTDSKPTPATSEKVTDGSTFYCSDNSKLYVWYKNQWYEKTATGGGGEPYVLPIASSETLGGVKVGSNLSINSETGVLSATDTIYSDFVGTDGTAAGTAGLVPAPVTTDADKFLKSDGTWATAGGGGIRTLTSADYDYHYSGSTDDGVALWRLSSGSYKIASGTKVYTDASFTGGAVVPTTTENFLNVYVSTSNRVIMVFGDTTGYLLARVAVPSTGQEVTSLGNSGTNSMLIGRSCVDNLTSWNLSSSPLSAKQGYVLNAKIESSILNGGTTAPSTSTKGSVGTLYSCANSGTAEVYMCTAVSGSTYTWTKIF